MKKLMIASVATVAAGGAFGATAVIPEPLVYSYTANVTHMYDKMVVVKDVENNENVNVYQKFSKNATITGYLIQDQHGATSQILGGSTAKVYDQGRNRAFLVVYNSGAEADVRAPKIIPAVLEAKRIDTKFKNDASGGLLQEGIAEGMLFAGGDLMAGENFYTEVTTNSMKFLTQTYPDDIMGGVRPKLENGNNFLDPYTTHDDLAKSVRQPAFYADYAWTSCYLFGEYNGPQFAAALWQKAQVDIDKKQRIITGNLFAGLGAAGDAFYHDTWLNHAGIGTYKQTKGSTAAVCCGLSAGAQAGKFVLNDLAGSFKGGIFLCSENGFEQEEGWYYWFKGVWWEDQFYSAGAGWDEAYAGRGRNAYWKIKGDETEDDVWTDGDIEVNTTDVAFGSWSITLTTLAGVAWTDDEIAALTLVKNKGRGYSAKAALTKLAAAIKAAANKLAGGYDKYHFYLDADNDGVGDEIHNVSVEDDFGDRFVVPFLTPKFVWAYGLADYTAVE